MQLWLDDVGPAPRNQIPSSDVAKVKKKEKCRYIEILTKPVSPLLGGGEASLQVPSGYTSLTALDDPERQKKIP